MDVFDSRSVHIHLDEDLTYVFTPGELALYPIVQSAIDRVRQRLNADAERRRREISANPFLSRFDRRSPLYAKIEALGASSSVDEFRQLAQLSAGERDELTRLPGEIEALKSGAPQTQLRVAGVERDDLAMVLTCLGGIAAFDPAAYRHKRQRLQEARALHDRATRTAFTGLTIPGLLDEPWDDFVQAGQRYIEETNDARVYPQAGDHCIYCQQVLGKEAVGLIRRYRDYCNDELRLAVNAEEDQVADTGHVLAALPLETAIQRLRGSINHDDTSEVFASALPILEASQRIRDIVNAREDLQLEDVRDTAGALAAEVEAQISRLDELTAGLRRQASDRLEMSKARDVRFLELESRRRLAPLLDGVETHVATAKWCDRALHFSRGFQGVLRSLTETSKEASERLLTQQFEERFVEECKRLRTPTVRLSFSGTHAQVARRKQVANHQLSEILSEGEQKVIALADFLAEVSLKGPTTPIVFDDPITSLDYKRLKEVAARLVELSESRQVIVFTHNIWFTSELLSRVEGRREGCFYYDVESDGERSGIVARGVSPRLDTFKTLRPEINTLTGRADKEKGPVQDALIEKAYELLRNVCEMMVEQDLLRGVTQRHQPNVMMNNLKQINYTRLEAACEKVSEIFERCCRYIGSHSQPRESLSVRPTLKELKEDWAALQAVRNGYLGE